MIPYSASTLPMNRRRRIWGPMPGAKRVPEIFGAYVFFMAGMAAVLLFLLQ
ncbi:MAG: hypothetical protein IT285_02480 [Bdellovibrionales bacterium]|nr:hypothetical protein [Bdellovibrionales bacterium]